MNKCFLLFIWMSHVFIFVWSQPQPRPVRLQISVMPISSQQNSEVHSFSQFVIFCQVSGQITLKKEKKAKIVLEQNFPQNLNPRPSSFGFYCLRFRPSLLSVLLCKITCGEKAPWRILHGNPDTGGSCRVEVPGVAHAALIATLSPPW